MSTLAMLCQEERVEQLRSFSFLSGVVAGFAVAALLQLQVDVNQTSQSFQMWFSISAGLCVSFLSLISFSADHFAHPKDTCFPDLSSLLGNRKGEGSAVDHN